MKQPLQTERDGSSMGRTAKKLFMHCFTTALLFLAVPWLGASAQPRNFVLTTETCPVCSEDQLATWRDTVDNTIGVAGKDPVGHQIGSYAARLENEARKRAE
jgi:hypothetical protein